MSYGIFTDKDKSFSFRKLMTIVATALFAYTVIGHQIVYKFAELPGSYQAIIAGVFAFYFAKELLLKNGQ